MMGEWENGREEKNAHNNVLHLLPLNEVRRRSNAMLDYILKRSAISNRFSFCQRLLVMQSTTTTTTTSLHRHYYYY